LFPLETAGQVLRFVVVFVANGDFTAQVYGFLIVAADAVQSFCTVDIACGRLLQALLRSAPDKPVRSMKMREYLFMMLWSPLFYWTILKIMHIPHRSICII
jgi:hypothetical protein